MFYELNKDKAQQLVEQQKFDGWSLEDVKNYWYSLGYDVFFVRGTIIKFYNNYNIPIK